MIVLVFPGLLMFDVPIEEEDSVMSSSLELLGDPRVEAERHMSYQRTRAPNEIFQTSAISADNERQTCFGQKYDRRKRVWEIAIHQ